MNERHLLNVLVAAAVVGLAGAGVAGCTLGTAPTATQADSTSNEHGDTVGSIAPVRGGYVLETARPGPSEA